MSAKKGFWFWLTLFKPKFWFLGKLLGGNAAKQSSLAIRYWLPVFITGAILIAVGVVAVVVLRLLNWM